MDGKRLAKAQGKPVLLGISAVWCHWCHVMDETTYSDPGVIRTINERFVPVRVDNDQRPDVNARYNMGGWPTTALLTPEGEIIYGGTYIPPDAMRQVLRQIDAFYSDPANRLSLAKRVHELRTVREARTKTPRGAELDDATAATVMQLIGDDFDERFGGFGNEQKFPHVPVLQFLLDYWQRTQDARAQTMVQRTLHAMASGGMYDHVAGGFFRYSTTPDFSIPHFEKMLEDLSGLLWACCRASALFDDAELARVAIDCKRYLDEHLWNDERHGYGGSQDADEEYYGLDATARAQRAEPYVDPTIYTAWNAQMAAALLLGGPLLGERIDGSDWQRRGVDVLESLWRHARRDGLMCRYNDGLAHLRGLLTDQAWMLCGLLAAHSATGEPRWLERATELLASTEPLYDAGSEAYVDRLGDDGEPARVAEPMAPLEENALLARLLLGVAAATARSDLHERALAILRRHAEHYESYRLFAAGYASAVLDVVAPPIDLHLVGDDGEPVLEGLLAAALRVATLAVRVDPVTGAAADRRTALGLGDETAAYLCKGKTCFARVSDPAALCEALRAHGARS